MQNDDIPFAPSPDRLSELSSAILSADPAGAAAALRQVTEVPIGDLPMAAMSIAACMWAFAEVVKQLRPVAQPFADAAAERMREAADADDSPGNPPGKA